MIVGGGAAGNAAAEMLRREGYAGPVTIIGADAALPVDRPNLSKDYLAGTAPEEWVWLRDEEFYARARIELVRGTRVTALDPEARRIQLSDGTSREYGTLLLATGADPVKLAVPGSEAAHVCDRRALADSRAISPGLPPSHRCSVVVGASFIALEAAAALRTRGLEVHVVALDVRPLERVLGPQLGDFVRALHEEQGVLFHLGHTIQVIQESTVVLYDGSRLPADLVVVGVGVRPSLALAEQAGLQVDRGVVVNKYLETSAPGVYAAGDIARWGRTHAPARASASSTGSSPRGRDRPPRGTCWAAERRSVPCRFFGASTTTFPLGTSDTPNPGIASTWPGASQKRAAWSRSAVVGGSRPWRRSTGTGRAWRRKCCSKATTRTASKRSSHECACNG